MLFQRLFLGSRNKQRLRASWRAKKARVLGDSASTMAGPVNGANRKSRLQRATKINNCLARHPTVLSHALNIKWHPVRLPAVELRDYQRYVWSRIIRLRERKRCRFALVNRPHYLEPNLPNPFIFGDSVADIINAAEKALALKNAAGSYL